MAGREVRKHEEDAGRNSLRLWLRLLACTNLIEAQVKTRLREDFSTTLPRFDMLAQLEAASKESSDGLSLSELSRRLMVSNGNLTGLTERLVKERLVSRTVSTTDRRTQRVRLTAAGRRALNAVTPDHREWIAGMFSDLSGEESTHLYELIGKLKDSVQANVAAGSPIISQEHATAASSYKEAK